MKKAIFIIITILIVAGAAIGIFFVNFALKRQSLDYEIPEVDDAKVLANAKEIKAHTQDWKNRVTPERWTGKSFDGLNLVANYYKNGDSHKYAIVVHGYTSKKEDMLSYGAYFYDWGYNVLAPDNRSHGESEGKWIGMGWLDSQDCLMWINRIVESDPNAEIIMLGVSMGGATVMMTSGLDLPENVKCLIEDCGYSSVWDEFSYQLKQMFNLPDFPVLYLSDITSGIICKYGLKEASSIDRLKKARIPMLFIHGTKDSFVPYSMLDKVVDAYKGPYCEVLRVPDAPHAEALRYGLQTYLKTVKDFIFKFSKGESEYDQK